MIVFKQIFNLFFYTILIINGFLLFMQYIFGINSIVAKLFEAVELAAVK